MNLVLGCSRAAWDAHDKRCQQELHVTAIEYAAADLTHRVDQMWIQSPALYRVQRVLPAYRLEGERHGR